MFLVSLHQTISIFVSDKVYCDSYDCPDNYKLVDDADDIMCKDKKCTKDKCCEKGEASPKHALREVGHKTKCHSKRIIKEIIIFAVHHVSSACP